MSKNIRMSVFDPASIQRALEETKKLKDRIENGNEEFVNDLAFHALNEADVNYTTANYDGDKGFITLQNTEGSKNGKNVVSRKVSANGEKILFIEFGSGVIYPENQSERADIISGENILLHGQYGDSKMFKKTGGRMWIYKPPGGGHKWSRGNMANSCMYFAKKDTEQRSIDIAKEVFDHD